MKTKRAQFDKKYMDNGVYTFMQKNNRNPETGETYGTNEVFRAMLIEVTKGNKDHYKIPDDLNLAELHNDVAWLEEK
ncbi:hypothetical protein [Aminipila luticellarii]|uniref:Uncharacterized protein n=1 Tax=Aminipila luticellarii TaxID=2507160 RepID=A0A410PX39_9FIRM|nr:hypothetical protein [Aminipila luticellarii]QAT43430.1 hypothetical protein EQM06_09505 [Aminipila luticellarii]